MTNLNWNRPNKSDGLQIKGKKPISAKTTSTSARSKSPLQKHGSHIIKLVLGPIQTKKPGLVHAGKFMCVKCNRLIKWASQEEIDFYQYRYGDGSQVHVTYQGFVDRYFTHTHKPVPTTPQEQIIYLINCYYDRDVVKSLGARWDEFHRSWFIKTSNPHLEKLRKWIHIDDYKKCGFEIPIPEPIDTSLPGGKLKQLLSTLIKK